AATAPHGVVAVGRVVLGRIGVGGGVLIIERLLPDHLRRVARAAEVLIGLLVGLVLVPGRGERRRDVGLRDRAAPGRLARAATATVTAAHGDRGVGVLRTELLRIRVGRGVLLAQRQLAERVG